MSNGKKVIIGCLIVIIVGSLRMTAYAVYDRYFRTEPREPFVQAEFQSEYVYPDMFTVTLNNRLKKIELSNYMKYFSETAGGLNARLDGYLYPIALNPDYEIKDIDFESYWATNEEVIGYIEFETLSVVSYPVLYRAGSDYYLTHNITGASDVYGAIYVEGLIADGHSATNTIIYGHNMKNGTMFGSLRKYKEESYFRESEYNAFFWYYTPTGKYRYQIFSVYNTPYDSDTFTWFAEPGDEYSAWLDKMVSQSMYDTGVVPSYDDEVITLCTCTSVSHSYRLIIQGRLIYKEEY